MFEIKSSCSSRFNAHANLERVLSLIHVWRGGSSSGTPTPQYKWIMTQMEIESQTKSYDNNEQLTSQTNQTLENVTLNANNTITVTLDSSTNTSTNYSYTTEIFTKMQVPFSNQ